MAKTLKELSDELKSATKSDIAVSVSSSKARSDAKALRMKMYEAEKKTGAPVPKTFEAWDALE
jgi:hypothetical protein